MILCFPVLGLETEDRGTAEADEALVSPSEITGNPVFIASIAFKQKVSS